MISTLTQICVRFENCSREYHVEIPSILSVRPDDNDDDDDGGGDDNVGHDNNDGDDDDNNNDDDNSTSLDARCLLTISSTLLSSSIMVAHVSKYLNRTSRGGTLSFVKIVGSSPIQWISCGGSSSNVSSSNVSSSNVSSSSSSCCCCCCNGIIGNANIDDDDDDDEDDTLFSDIIEYRCWF